MDCNYYPNSIYDNFYYVNFSESALKDINLTLSILIVLIFIVLGIVFDMVGISVTVADKKYFILWLLKK